MDRLRRVDRRVVGRLFFAPRRLQLAVEQAGGGGELLHPDQRGDQLAHRQRGRVDRVVGARVGDEAVHVEVLGDPHRARGGDAEAAGGVGAEGGRVVGGRRPARVLARRDRLDRAGAGGAGEGAVGLRLLPEFVGRVVGLEAAVRVLELGEQFPEGFGDVGAALHLALDDQAQGGALHAADREEVRAEAAAGERDRAGQRRPPEQVDVLAGGAGVGQRVGELVELVEGALDLLLGQRRVAGALDPQGAAVGVLARAEVRVGFEHLLQSLEPDQLALAVEVGRDHQLVGPFGHFADRFDDVFVGRLLDQRGVDQVVQVGLLPVRVALGKGRAEHVALEADRHLLVAVLVGPGVEGDFVGFVRLRLVAAEDVGDLLGAVVLLGDDQSHGAARVAGAFGCPLRAAGRRSP